VAWGDGTTSPATVDPATRQFTASHVYIDNPAGKAAGPFAITATATDNGGLLGVATTSVTVTNTAPALTSLSNSAATKGMVKAGQPVTVTGSFTDPGLNDAHSLTILWGDSSRPEVVPLTLGARSFSVTHTYTRDGQFNIVVQVRDPNNPSPAQQTKAVIGSPAPIVFGAPPTVVVAAPPAAASLAVPLAAPAAAASTTAITVPSPAVGASSSASSSSGVAKAMPTKIAALAIGQPDPADTIRVVKSNAIRIAAVPPKAAPPAPEAPAAVRFDEATGAWLPWSDAAMDYAEAFDDFGEAWTVLPHAIPRQPAARG
jgi:hypothetical protein